MNSLSKEQTICDGNKLYIQCPANHYISITNAWFGRKDTKTCLNYAFLNGCASCSTNCYLDITTNVKKYSNGKNSYTFTNSQITSTDPCHGTYKYFKIYFDCSSDSFKTIMPVIPTSNLMN